MISRDSSQVTKAHFSPAFSLKSFQVHAVVNFSLINFRYNFFMKHEMWLYLIYKHCPIENGTGITSDKAVVLPVIYQWRSAVEFDGITTGKTVDSSGKTLVIPLISSVISVDNSGDTCTTKFYHWFPLINHWKLVVTPLIFHRYKTGNTTKFYR